MKIIVFKFINDTLIINFDIFSINVLTFKMLVRSVILVFRKLIYIFEFFGFELIFALNALISKLENCSMKNIASSRN